MQMPAMVVDCHHHLWDLDANRYPWLLNPGPHPMFGDDYDILRRNYRIEEFLADIGDLPIAMSVHLQADHDPADPVRESRWLDEVAKTSESRGFPHAVVGYADFFDGNVGRVLEGHAAVSRVKGIRQTLHHRRGHPLRNATWLGNFKLLRNYGFSFDLQVYPGQAEDGLKLVDDNRDLQFILPHSGLPADRSPEGVQIWRSSLRRFAERENVACKLSGFGMLKRDWRTEDIRPIILDVIDIFGPERCIFGSNFPVDRFAGSYRKIWTAFFEITQGFSAAEKEAMFWSNPIKIYRMDKLPLTLDGQPERL